MGSCTLGQFCCECKVFAFTDRACKHIAGAKHTFGSPPPPPGKGWRRRRRRREITGTPDISRSRRMSKNCKNAHVRHNLLRGAQVYTRLGNKRGRNLRTTTGSSTGRTRTSAS